MSREIVATVECRMTSTRLPGKVLLTAGGKPLLQILVERLSRVKQINAIVLATTTNNTDDPIEQLASALDVLCYRGSEDDVLKRVLEAGRTAQGSIIVEITGDCPLIDPNIVAQTIDLYLNNKCDYASNIDPVTFPVGMDVQVFALDLLGLADQETTSQVDREHVSWFIRRQPERFKKIHLPAPPELHWPELEITLDEKEDYELIKNIYENLSNKNRFFSCLDIIQYLKGFPHLLEINRHIKRKNFNVDVEKA